MTKKKEKFSNSETRSVRKKGEYLIYTIKRHKLRFYLSDHPELKKILQRRELVPYLGGEIGHEKLMPNYYQNGKYVKKISLHELALGCYEGRVKDCTFLDDILAYRQYRSENGLNIDHADNISRNNTRYNLSAMPVVLNNNKKADIVSRFILPSHLSVAVVNGSYRVRKETEMTNSFPIQKLVIAELMNKLGVIPIISDDLPTIEYKAVLCKNPYEFVDCLRFMAEYRVDGCKCAVQPARLKDKSKWWNGQLERSLRAQKELAEMWESEFTEYSAVHH